MFELKILIDPNTHSYEKKHTHYKLKWRRIVSIFLFFDDDLIDFTIIICKISYKLLVRWLMDKLLRYVEPNYYYKGIHPNAY